MDLLKDLLRDLLSELQMELQMELTRQRIPFEVRSGLRFFEQAHIKDILCYMRILQNPRDELAWLRLDFAPARARRVKVVFGSNAWLMLSELELLSVEPATVLLPPQEVCHGPR